MVIQYLESCVCVGQPLYHGPLFVGVWWLDELSGGSGDLGILCVVRHLDAFLWHLEHELGKVIICKFIRIPPILLDHFLQHNGQISITIFQSTVIHRVLTCPLVALKAAKLIINWRGLCIAFCVTPGLFVLNKICSNQTYRILTSI